MGKLILVGFIINFVIALFLIYLPYTKGNYNGVLLFSINVLSKLRLIKEKQKVLDNMNEGIKKFKSQIDEVKSNKELKKFASYYQLLNRQDHPVALMMAGLPENISVLQNEDVMTFRLRDKRIALSSLNLIQI